MSPRTLPLGIDIGATRIRIAEVTCEENFPLLARVCIIDLTAEGSAPQDEQYLAACIKTTLAEAGIRERRCILAVSELQATLHTVRFPPMSAREREQAGRFEAMRHIEYPLEDALVRSVSLSPSQGLYALGILKASAMRHIQGIVKSSGLRPIAVDHEAYALQRAFPYADAILDMGHSVARLYAFGREAPLGFLLDGGAHTFTQALARGFSIDLRSAEHRKRSIGLAGAGEAEMNAFASSVGRALLHARNYGIRKIQRLILVGNGARLLGLPERLERDTGCSIDVADHLATQHSAYPIDITRASAPDWALSVGLALWSVKEPSPSK